jgi:hypothetical protein
LHQGRRLFYVYKYHGNNGRFDKGRLIGRIKAYVWHDVIEYVRKNLLLNESTNLNINCEKDFAFIEEKAQSTLTNDDNKGGGEILSGYQIYLNKEGDEPPKGQNFWDVTVSSR